jgi:hypothetical protein
LVQGADQAIYSVDGDYFFPDVFRLQVDARFTILHSFPNEPIGNEPLAPLVVARDGLYGITLEGGRFFGGTVFRVSPTCQVGDVNGDGTIDVSDVFALIDYLFAGGAAPLCAGDVNGDSVVSTADVFYLLNFLFAGGPPPI